MVTSMIPSVDNIFVNKSIIDMRFLSAYNPLINYDWSTTTTGGLRYLKDVGSTPTYNASMYFGRGAYFNGVDQSVMHDTITLSADFTYITTKQWDGNTFDIIHGGATAYIGIANSNSIVLKGTTYTYIPLNTTLLSKLIYNICIKRIGNILYAYINGVEAGNTSITVESISLNTVSRYGSAFGEKIIKDLFIFNRTLTQSEITQSYEQPELFYAMAQADSTCVLNMPMCETSSTVRNYKTGIDYPITNYTTSVRDNANRLQYGLQTCKFVRDSLGVIQSASSFLECDGVGYAIIPSHADTVNIKMTVNPTLLSGNLLSGGVTKTLTGLTLNVDNEVVVSNVTPTGAITLASGFSGTIKSYKEELV